MLNNSSKENQLNSEKNVNNEPQFTLLVNETRFIQTLPDCIQNNYFFLRYEFVYHHLYFLLTTRPN